MLKTSWHKIEDAARYEIFANAKGECSEGSIGYLPKIPMLSTTQWLALL